MTQWSRLALPCPQSISKWRGHPSLSPTEGGARWGYTTHHLPTSIWTRVNTDLVTGQLQATGSMARWKKICYSNQILSGKAGLDSRRK